MRTLVQKTILTALFIVFVFPISIAGLSANYSFVLFPIFYILIVGKVKIPNIESLKFMCLFALIFVVSSIYQFEYYDRAIRRTASFMIFMSMFSYMFIPIDNKMVVSFKAAIIIISLCFSGYSLYLFYNPF